MRVKRRMNIFIVLSIRTQRLSQHSDESMPAVLAGACVGEYIADHRGKAEGQKVSRGRPVADVDRLARLFARCHTVRGNHLTPQVLEEDTVCDNRHVFETHCGPWPPGCGVQLTRKAASVPAVNLGAIINL